MNGEMQIHEVANIFPEMDNASFAALKADIKANGLLEPIWIHDGKIIDGRHRYRACCELGIQPQFKQWDGSGSLVQFVVSLNLHRRHLTSSQLAFVGVDILPHLEAEAKQRQETGNNQHSLRELIPQGSTGKSADQAADVVGSNGRYVSDAKKLQAEAPALAAQVRAGVKTITQAKRELKEQVRETRRKDNWQKVAAAPSPQVAVKAAKFATILVDPPWDWGDEGDVNQLGRAKPDYATLGIQALMDLPVEKLADTDCHLYLWITNRSLPKGFQLIEQWGFRYITCLTWVKPSFGMGNYFRGQTEHLLFGVRGSQMLKRKDVPTVFHAPRGAGGHSSKPSEIYGLIESCSPGPYVELFSRSNRDGWVTWGECDGN